MPDEKPGAEQHPVFVCTYGEKALRAQVLKNAMIVRTLLDPKNESHARRKLSFRVRFLYATFTETLRRLNPFASRSAVK
ncbi:MAG: hypothetical protein KM296_05355 [Brockia lithotrophica]|nr:hypothetical protein [Brockia lithotrophica]